MTNDILLDLLISIFMPTNNPPASGAGGAIDTFAQKQHPTAREVGTIALNEGAYGHCIHCRTGLLGNLEVVQGLARS